MGAGAAGGPWLLPTSVVAGTDLGAELVVLDVDATIVVGHSEMGNAAVSRIG